MTFNYESEGFSATVSHDEMEDDSTERHKLDLESIHPANESADEMEYGVVMSKKEASRIRMFRLMVAGMLLMTAAVTIMAYFLLSREETNVFETAYAQFARTLADAAINQQQSVIDALRSVSNEITTHAATSNMTWPFVYLPYWESNAFSFFDLCQGEFLAVQNYVAHEDRDDFVDWTTQHHEDWVKEGHMIRYGNLDALNQDPSHFRPYISQKTSDGKFIPDEERSYYAVRTAQSPPMRKYGPTMNMNIATLPGNELIFDGILALEYETLTTRIKPFSAVPPEEHQKFHTDSEADNPHSFMIAPIHENVRDDESKIVAFLTTAVAWDASMQNLLPENVQGILCVVSNNCGQTFTYEVSGHDAFYLGDGDHHSGDYDHLKVTVDLTQHSHPNFAATPGHCMYTMHIYPTDKFKNEYTTAMPTTFAVVVFSTFALVAIVFFVYDWLVQRRNRELVTTAARSDKVVSALFPGEIKDKVLAQQNIGESSSGNTYLAKTRSSINSAAMKSSPLAQEYDNTTVFFGDLGGFTAWSSSRTPEQVFELLESIYSSFDAIAKRRRVFKVETIGDCYVAATGLPRPQPDHAVRMSRFASDCMHRMNTLTAELSVTLGSDTAQLKLRVGLNSGKITGGVLKGDKSRFQLFGDTMNTASRMESNGLPGRIHLSASTAEELRLAGKEDWLVEREDKIVAKGKGRMDTYYLIIPSSEGTTATRSSFSRSFHARPGSSAQQPEQAVAVNLQSSELGFYDDTLEC